jgi:3-oxoacyl-[acyl-carrier-protein] synthase II
MNLKRVVVTGMGTLTPIGNSFPTFRKAVLEGANGINPITKFDSENIRTKFACELKNFNILDYLDKKEASKIDDSSQYALVACMEAVGQSNLLDNQLNKERIGVILGTGIGGIHSLLDPLKDYHQSNTPHFSPFFILKVMSNMMAGIISLKFGFKGPNYVTASACASSANAIIDAFHFIQMGKADVMITGGSEACIIVPVVDGFNAMRALSTRNDDIYTASRPFDLNRDGFVIGEGAGVLVLEELEHARKRNATIYAELAGVGVSADAYHITAPHPEGEGGMRSMQAAIDNAGISLNEIDHINAHATSTPVGDLAECKAIRTLFGAHASKILLTSTKSMTGHLLGAAAAVESLAAIIAILDQKIPPTINQIHSDPEFADLNIVKNQACSHTIKTVLSNSFGFGGHNSSIIYKKFDS